MTRSDSTRRSFLQSSAVAGAAALTVPATARAATSASLPTGKVVVVVFQRGGADFLNLFAPTADANYATLRPTIGLRPPGSPSGTVGLAMDSTFAMHPSMAGIHAAFTAPSSKCAVVHAVGYSPANRSHFVSEALYETSLQVNQLDGWINRHLQATAGPNQGPVRALAMRGSLPRSMMGAHAAYSVASTRDLVLDGTVDDKAALRSVIEQTTTAGMDLNRQGAYRSGIEALGLIDLFSTLSPSTYQPANGAVYPTSASTGSGTSTTTTTFGQQLKEIAEVIKAGLGIEFFAVDIGGWDHHYNLPSSIAPLAANLSQGISAFFTDIGALASDVVVVTMSEFGREVRQNGSQGTDHGVGGAMVVWGGNVLGGQVRGVWPGLATSALQDGRFLAARNDYRDVLREVLVSHMGGTDPNFVFPGRTAVPIGLF
ncbi:MAG: hypothetical protein RL148_1423 [Planctomycetota bacterium]